MRHINNIPLLKDKNVGERKKQDEPINQKNYGISIT